MELVLGEDREIGGIHDAIAIEVGGPIVRADQADHR